MRSITYTLRNGLDVEVEYTVDADGVICLGAAVPIAMPATFIALHEDEAADIAGIAAANEGLANVGELILQ